MKDDLRAWLEKVEQLGDLKRINGADWDKEIGCISALNSNKIGPALLFDNIKGYPPGYRVLSSVNVRLHPIALTLFLPTSLSEAELSSVLVKKMQTAQAKAQEFPPTEVNTGPVMQNICSGREVDLFKFPSPIWHELDGGRYIGTGCVVITKDPDNQEVNLGCYRVMIHDRKTLGIHIEPERHGREHMDKYRSKGKPCPIAVSFGDHPLMYKTAGMYLPPGAEYGFAGAMRSDPIEVITDEVTGLPMPADSEIVAVGWSPPNRVENEGPFGEWPGYYASGIHPEPVIEVERVYYRDDPIIVGSPPHRPKWSDNIQSSRLIMGAHLHHDLVNMGIPGIKSVAISQAAHFEMIIVSIKQRYHGHAKQVGLALAQHRMAAAGGGGRYIIIVDEDIDPNDMDDVFWAIATRADPERDIEIIHRAPTDHLDPLLRPHSNVFLNSRAIITACRPYEWINEFPKSIDISPELMKTVKEKWGKVLEF